MLKRLMVKKLAGQGAEAVGGPPDAFTAHVRRERSKWSDVIRSAGIVPN